ncbi:hypothetical protein CsSME_00014041 [Camellia sinensis var. sinensis]
MSSAALAVDISKALLLPLDVAKHNTQANRDLVNSALQSMVVANQKTHLTLGRYDEIEQQLLESRERVGVVIRALKLEKEKKKEIEHTASRLKQGLAISEKARLLAAEAVKKDEAQIAELKAELKLAEDRYWQQGWDEAGVAYLTEFRKAKYGIYAQAWNDALTAAKVPNSSPLYKEIPASSTGKGQPTTQQIAPSSAFAILLTVDWSTFPPASTVVEQGALVVPKPFADPTTVRETILPTNSTAPLDAPQK